jgi:hypothetical protein
MPRFAFWIGERDIVEYTLAQHPHPGDLVDFDVRGRWRVVSERPRTGADFDMDASFDCERADDDDGDAINLQPDQQRRKRQKPPEADRPSE